jgi:hypothetical protein
VARSSGRRVAITANPARICAAIWAANCRAAILAGVCRAGLGRCGARPGPGSDRDSEHRDHGRHRQLTHRGLDGDDAQRVGGQGPGQEPVRPAVQVEQRHLHVDGSDDAPWAEWFLTSSCLALAVLLAERQAPPGGFCQSSSCGRPFVNVGRGTARRYSSAACGTRERVAAHRQARNE